MSDHHKLISLGQKNTHVHSHSSKKEDEDEVEELYPEAIPSIIFDAHHLHEEVPEGFNAVRISLDATLKSDLLWEKEQKAAEKYIQKGFRIFWDINFGLLNHYQSIANQSQFLSLSLALEHFRDTLWKKFRQNTVGVCLYRGTANFSQGIVWNDVQLVNLREWLKDVFNNINCFVTETLCNVSSFDEITSHILQTTIEGERLLAIYCRNIIGKYLSLLSDRLPDTLQRFVLLDIESIRDSFLQVQLTTNEGFFGINLGVKGPLFNENNLGWEGISGHPGVLRREIIDGKDAETVRIGVCMPPMLQYVPSKWKSLEKVIVNLNERKVSFRIIPEVSLTTDWDGLDYIIVSMQNTSPQGLRKLQGFRAAGGQVISADDYVA